MADDLLFSVAGWAVGFTSCRIVRAIIERHLMAGRLHTPNLGRIAPSVLIILALLSVLVGAVNTYRQQQQLHCQTRYNAAFIAAVKQRAVASDQDRAATKDALTGLLAIPRDGTASRDASRVVIQQYLKAVSRADDKRADSPYPAKASC
jgi:hypothetical protein